MGESRATAVERFEPRRCGGRTARVALPSATSSETTSRSVTFACTPAADHGSYAPFEKIIFEAADSTPPSPPYLTVGEAGASPTDQHASSMPVCRIRHAGRAHL